MIVFVWKEMFTCMYVQLTKYKITFFTSLLNIIIKVFAMSLMWKAVYIQNASSSELNLDQMLIYSTMSIAISQCLTWWEGPHFFALSRVRTGTIILDMFKPINFPMQLFIRGSSEFVLNLITYTVPTILVGIVLIKMKMVFSIHNFMLFGLAFIISYLLLFEFQLILAFISIKTLELNGIIHFFHAMVMLFSCQVIPMDMYPKFMQVIINLLPFKYIFYFPLSIIITMVPFNVDVFKNTIIIEIVWLVILAIICLRLWKWSKGEVCVQGG